MKWNNGIHTMYYYNDVIIMTHVIGMRGRFVV